MTREWLPATPLSPCTCCRVRMAGLLNPPQRVVQQGRCHANFSAASNPSTHQPINPSPLYLQVSNTLRHGRHNCRRAPHRCLHGLGQCHATGRLRLFGVSCLVLFHVCHDGVGPGVVGI